MRVSKMVLLSLRPHQRRRYATAELRLLYLAHSSWLLSFPAQLPPLNELVALSLKLWPNCLTSLLTMLHAT